MSDYTDANGMPVEVGSLHWNNNLDLVRVTMLADWPADREGDVNRDPYCSPWHKCERISDGRVDHFDSGRYGRLATFHPVTGQDARKARWPKSNG